MHFEVNQVKKTNPKSGINRTILFVTEAARALAYESQADTLEDMKLYYYSQRILKNAFCHMLSPL